MTDSDDAKYITFKRSDFEEHVFGGGAYVRYEVQDAVVIRRQDLFASPCLATYAQMIAMVANNIGDPEKSKELLAIADYFHRQAELAAAEGYKLPDR